MSQGVEKFIGIFLGCIPHEVKRVLHFVYTMQNTLMQYALRAKSKCLLKTSCYCLKFRTTKTNSLSTSDSSLFTSDRIYNLDKSVINI